MSNLKAFLSLAAMTEAITPTTRDYRKMSNPNGDLMKSIDIDTEYELILQKKSKLSASQRSVVTYLYHNKKEMERKENDKG